MNGPEADSGRANWAPCANCPHNPDDHEAIPVKTIAIDPPARAVFEGMLGACQIIGCRCRMWSSARLAADSESTGNR